MKLTAMRYKDFVWPHNPRVYTIQFERKMAAHKIPFGRYALQDLGLTRRVMQGEGEFVGKNAYETFKKLAAVFYQNGPGELIHPVWQTTGAYFVSLSLRQEPRPDLVRYAFTFWEEYGTSGQSLESTVQSAVQTSLPQTEIFPEIQYYTAKQGETLWSIAHDHGLSWGELLEKNPQIKNPNTVQGGETLRVR